MSRFLYLNGAIVPSDEARISPLDRGFLFGDGLFETMRVYGGRIHLLRRHLERLERGCAALGIRCPEREGLVAALRLTLEANGATDAVLRLTVSRGAGAALRPAPAGPPTILITLRPLLQSGSDAGSRSTSARNTSAGEIGDGMIEERSPERTFQEQARREEGGQEWSVRKESVEQSPREASFEPSAREESFEQSASEESFERSASEESFERSASEESFERSDRDKGLQDRSAREETQTDACCTDDGVQKPGSSEQRVAEESGRETSGVAPQAESRSDARRMRGEESLQDRSAREETPAEAGTTDDGDEIGSAEQRVAEDSGRETPDGVPQVESRSDAPARAHMPDNHAPDAHVPADVAPHDLTQDDSALSDPAPRRDARRRTASIVDASDETASDVDARSSQRETSDDQSMTRPASVRYDVIIPQAVVTLRTRHVRPAMQVAVKSLSYVASVLGSIELESSGAAEGIMLTDDGVVAEGTVSNLFCVLDGALVTPPVELGILPGVTRERVLELARAAGLETREAPFDLPAMKSASECFYTNSVRELVPIGSIDGAIVGDGAPGPVSLRLLELYRRELPDEDR